VLATVLIMFGGHVPAQPLDDRRLLASIVLGFLVQASLLLPAKGRRQMRAITTLGTVNAVGHPYVRGMPAVQGVRADRAVVPQGSTRTWWPTETDHELD
jgi:hypothetical protein